MIAFPQQQLQQQQQSTSVYLVNLLVADLLLLLALPFKILKDLGAAPWNLMVFHCQASAVTMYISLYASIAFLAFIITDRYLQVPCGLFLLSDLLCGGKHYY